MNRTILKFHLVLITSLLTHSALVQAGPWSTEAYRMLEGDCDGLVKLPIGTTENTCLGLVLDRTAKDPTTEFSMRFPRKIVQLPNSDDFILVDMGGWDPKNNGRVFRIIKNGSSQYQLKLLFRKLNLPHDVEIGPDQKVYIGEMGQIFRFDPEDPNLKKEIVISGLPTNLTSSNMHPLNSFSFGKGSTEWDIFVNVGSPTDACKKSAPGLCKEVDDGKNSAIWRYKYLGNGQWESSPKVFARGLRNSMAQVIHPSGTFLQGENGRNLSLPNEPYEELNVLKSGKHYGFPYCYNFNGVSPEWETSSQKRKCTDNTYEKPYFLMPPNVAPLDMLYYSGRMFPELKDHLIMSWHGHKPAGNRIVAYPVDQNGLPKLNSNRAWSYNIWDVNSMSGSTNVTANPGGGNLRGATAVEIVNQWFAKKGLRPNGSPVGITEARDGSIWIVADYNRTILRMARGQNWQPRGDEGRLDPEETKNNSMTSEEADRLIQGLNANPEQLNRWKNLEKIFLKQCSSCHSEFSGKETLKTLLMKDSWLIPGETEKSKLYGRIKKSNTGTPMPPTGWLPEQEQNLLKDFILNLKRD